MMSYYKEKGRQMFTSKKSKVTLLSTLALVIVAGIATILFPNAWSKMQADENNQKDSTPAAKEEKVQNKLLPAQNQLLVKYKETATKEKKDAFIAKHGAKVKNDISQLGVSVLSLTATDPEQKAKEIRKLDNDVIEYVEPDYYAEATLTPNDQYYATNQSKWYVTAKGQIGWDISQGDNVIIGVADTGVDPTHPDLIDKLLPGWNFYDNTAVTSDVYGHGTPTAGVASASSNNTIGVVGSSLNSKILPMRISGTDGYASYSAMASAIIYGADHGASVVNLSYGGTSPSSTLQNAVNYAKAKNVVVVASAGNDGAEVINYPASLDGVISVSGLDSGSNYTTRASWSSFNSYVDVSASDCSYATAKGGGYRSFCGTSNSAPVVTGLVALMKSINPNLTVQQVTDYLTQNATDIGTAGFDKYFGFGRIDYEKTLAAVKSGVISTPANGVIAGKITDQSSIAISGATVSVSLSSALISTTQSLPDGSFTFDLAPGTYSVKVADSNYVTQTRSVAVSSNAIATADFSLLPAPTPDIIAPVVSLTSPAESATVKIGSKSPVSATATDQVGVTKVEFYLDGKLIKSDAASPYSFTWSPNKKVAVGIHTITAKAYDAAGNTSTSMVNITVVK